MKNILIIVVIILIAIESYILIFKDDTENKPLVLPTIDSPQPTSSTTATLPDKIRTTGISYYKLFQNEAIDNSWAGATEKQIIQSLQQAAQQSQIHFDRFAIACKTSICKLEISNGASDQPFSIIAATVVHEMKKQGWKADVSKLEEKIMGEQTTGKATIFLINPTR